MAKATAEMDLAVYLEKAATDLQSRFGDWLVEVVGYEPSKAKTKDEAFREGVRLATALRMPFQRSDENQGVLSERRAEQAEPEKPVKAVRATKKTAAASEEKPAKATARGSRKAKEEEPEESAKPAKKATPAKKAEPTRNKRRPAPATPAEEEEAPF